ncbi:3-hydroxyacyl-CoA dehydrogenase NAD-binding domain-containing protein [Kushneria aurantia]|uniref:L-gulonate 3-dehydrogenase n=1 Tax=Kushneria aurantia TaxID=504092 RepID=A0ABV6G0Q1_9GAMM|nr:3-hydroxyacyl-CoA dehydrogenase NAD-binding domain-containing protein [Kushneria aurantia]
MEHKTIVVLGAGRMGEGIALSFLLAGHAVVLIDLKERGSRARQHYYEQVRHRLEYELVYLSDKGLLAREDIASITTHLQIHSQGKTASPIEAALVFEALPEVSDIKRMGLEWISLHVSNEVVIASTTSTFLINELAGMVANPARFMNAHWLNPAHLMPLIEVSGGKATEKRYLNVLIDVLKGIGKVPVVCHASPGYIVPRLQVLLMNEAARMVEEGVASTEDIDMAIRLGLGLRYSVLGALEFVDWGGGDTLYYASGYLCGALDERFKTPPIIIRNMQKRLRGFQDGAGFFDYTDVDLEVYRRQRADAFLKRLALMNLMPVVKRQSNA